MTAFYKYYRMLVSKRHMPFQYACESHWFWENYCSFHSSGKMVALMGLASRYVLG